MHGFIGTKVVKATPMDRREYNVYRGWDLPKNEDGSDEGFLIEYEADPNNKPNDERHAGYISWSPADVFQTSYQSMNRMNFGHAIEMLKRGNKIYRRGWNGKDMFLYLVPAESYPAQTGVAKAYWGENALVPYGAYIAMKTADGTVVPWLASQTDVLAEDWAMAPAHD